MISERQIDLIIEQLINRIQEANTYFLMEMGSSIKKIRNLTPTKAQQLVQILKYGGNYEDIIKELSNYTNLNIKDIDKIFSSYAKKDQMFYEKFYKYRNIPFVEYAENEALKRQTEALANIVKNEMYNFTRANVLGYTIRDLKGRPQFIGLRETYNRVLDEALVNVGTGKESFDSAMTRIMKDIGGSGLKTIEYESGRSMRLDSAVRMHLKSRLRELHNENQKIIGEEFGSNMVEVSHHSNSAPDHIDTIDGKQFARIDVIKEQIKKGEEKEIKLSDIDGNRVKVKDKWYNDFDSINNKLVRPVSTLNCYHYTFEGILGITQPEFTEEELKADKEKNLAGFEYEDKHYSLYEGQQLLRKIELEIRKAKDEQILGRSSGIVENIEDAQNRITLLTHKYKDVLKASGLPSKLDRARVVGYHRVSTKKLK